MVKILPSRKGGGGGGSTNPVTIDPPKIWHWKLRSDKNFVTFSKNAELNAITELLFTSVEVNSRQYLPYVYIITVNL